MTTYTKLVDYAAKDLLLTGDPAKTVKGTEVGAEFDAIAAADATNVKDSGNQTIAGTKTFSSTIAGSITGNAATVTVADAAADTTTWPMLATSQTGNLAPATDGGLTYDASTNVLTVGELKANGTAGGLEVTTTNSADTYQVLVAGSMTLDSATLNSFQHTTTVTGGATTTTIRGFLNNPTLTPSANPTSVFGEYNLVTLNNGASVTTFVGHNSTIALGASALGGTITSAYGYYANESFNASATTDITTWASYYAEDIADGAGTTVTNARAFVGAMASGTNRYNCYMSGTAPNYFAGDMQFSKTITPSGTTGAQTINKTSGTVNFAAGAASLVVTNNLVSANSIIICTVGTNDATMKAVQAVAAAGSFTLYPNANPTAETRVNFLVTN